MISQRKIAEHLKIGRSTVANILRGDRPGKYSEETRRAVFDAAEKLGYRPNRASRSVRLGRSNLIGIIHFGSFYEVGMQVADVVPQAITAHGYDLFVVDPRWNGRNMARSLEQLVEARVEGVIICHMMESFGPGEVGLLKRAQIPVVSLSGNEKWGVPMVYANSRDAIRRMVHHLCGVGHRRLLLLTNQYEARTTLNRMAGFRDGIAEVGGIVLPQVGEPDSVCRFPEEEKGIVGRIVRCAADVPYEPAHQYVRRLIETGTLPDVLVCSNDVWARGAITALLEAGLRVPEDVAVTGFDNNSFSNYPPYYLTTVAQPIREESAKAVEMLLTLLRGEPLEQQQHVFDCELVIRRSCGSYRETTLS